LLRVGVTFEVVFGGTLDLYVVEITLLPEEVGGTLEEVALFSILTGTA